MTSDCVALQASQEVHARHRLRAGGQLPLLGHLLLCRPAAVRAALLCACDAGRARLRVRDVPDPPIKPPPQPHEGQKGVPLVPAAELALWHGLPALVRHTQDRTAGPRRSSCTDNDCASVHVQQMRHVERTGMKFSIPKRECRFMSASIAGRRPLSPAGRDLSVAARVDPRPNC